MRGGMSLAGVVNLQKFIEDGGLVHSYHQLQRAYQSITESSAASRFRNRASFRRAARFTMPHSLIGAVRLPTDMLKRCRSISTRHRYFRSLRGGGGGLVAVAAKGRRRAGGARPSGRGTLTDPDIVQAMPQAAPAHAAPTGRVNSGATTTARAFLHSARICGHALCLDLLPTKRTC